MQHSEPEVGPVPNSMDSVFPRCNDSLLSESQVQTANIAELNAEDFLDLQFVPVRDQDRWVVRKREQIAVHGPTKDFTLICSCENASIS